MTAVVCRDTGRFWTYEEWQERFRERPGDVLEEVVW